MELIKFFIIGVLIASIALANLTTFWGGMLFLGVSTIISSIVLAAIKYVDS